jgi:hypothetical protein
MIASSDPLAQRVADWAARINTADENETGELALQGWALREAIRRRGASADHLVEAVERKLSPIPAALIPRQIEHALAEWNQLLADLDSGEENFEHVRRQARDVFFLILESLIVAEDSGGADEELLAQGLFNAVATDLYAFESMADVAAELQRRGHDKAELSDLFCSAVAGLFDGEVRLRPKVDAEAEEFIPISAVIRGKSQAKSLTPAALEKRLASIPWWYIKWSAQRLTMAIVAKTTDLHIYVWNGENPAKLAASHDLNGWQIRIGHGTDVTSSTISDGTVTLKLPKRIDPANFVLQIKDPANTEWMELFGRLEEKT